MANNENKESNTDIMSMTSEEDDAKKVKKWAQGKQLAFTAVTEDEERIRSFVTKDFFIYLGEYLFPPLSLFIDKFADYPLNIPTNFALHKKIPIINSWVLFLSHAIIIIVN